MGNVGAFLGSCRLHSTIVYSLGMKISDQVRAGTAPERGRGAASSICTRVTDTSQTLPLDLIGCIQPGAVDSCKSNYSHWVEPQTVAFYTADLSDHKDNFSEI